MTEPTKRKGEAARGFLRALTADLIGGPVDLAEQVVNLGLAGYGAAGHKLGLLRADEMPRLLEGSPGTSDWFAKGTPLEDQGAPAYQMGRIAPSAVGLLAMNLNQAGAPSRALKSIESQRGALRVGGDPYLIPAHQSQGRTLLGKTLADTPLRELYSPSIAITDYRNRRQPLIEGFGGAGGNVWLIPRIGAFSPAVGPTTLFNRDAFTARWRQFPAARSLPFTAVPGMDPREPQAAARLVDKGLLSLEQSPWGQGKKPEWETILRTPGSRGREGPFLTGLTGSHAAAVALSPRFQSFAHYENSPMGAGLLRLKGESGDIAEKPFQNIGRIIETYRGGWPYTLSGDKWLNEVRETMNVASPADRAALYRYLDQLKKTVPSEYGELKVRGPVQISPENFAGFLTADVDPSLAFKASQIWGLDVVDVSGLPRKEAAWIALQLQHSAPLKKGGEKSLSEGFLRIPRKDGS